MSQLFTSQQHQREEAWCWPLNLDGYDKAPQLSANESAALQKLFVLTQGHIYPRTKQILQRLVRPIDDALTAIQVGLWVCVVYRHTSDAAPHPQTPLAHAAKPARIGPHLASPAILRDLDSFSPGW